MEREEAPRLVSSIEAAALLGITANTFYQWRHRGKLPEPLVELAVGPIWLAEDIEALAAERAA
jgi:predicted DNA-binding transcriptional regulator AlpA